MSWELVWCGSVEGKLMMVKFDAVEVGVVVVDRVVVWWEVDAGEWGEWRPMSGGGQPCFFCRDRPVGG